MVVNSNCTYPTEFVPQAEQFEHFYFINKIYISIDDDGLELQTRNRYISLHFQKYGKCEKNYAAIVQQLLSGAEKEPEAEVFEDIGDTTEKNEVVNSDYPEME